MREPWKMKIAEYLGTVMVLSKDASLFSSGPLEVAPLDHDRDYAIRAAHPTVIGVTLHVNSIKDFVIYDEVGDKAVGGVAPGFIYVEPKWRGMGLMSEIYVLLDELGRKEDTYFLTEMSFAARKAAHAKQVYRAVNAGLPVPPGVLAEYREGPKGLRLRQDVTPDMANENARIENERRKSVHMTREYRFTTERFADDSDLREFWNLDVMGENGLRDAAALREAAGSGEIIGTMEVDEGRIVKAVFQLRIGDEVLDAAGRRPAEDAVNDLMCRREIPMSSHWTQNVFDTPEEAMGWLAKTAPDVASLITPPEAGDIAPYLAGALSRVGEMRAAPSF